MYDRLVDAAMSFGDDVEVAPKNANVRRAATINDLIFRLAGYGSTRGGKRLDSSPDSFFGACRSP